MRFEAFSILSADQRVSMVRGQALSATMEGSVMASHHSSEKLCLQRVQSGSDQPFSPLTRTTASRDQEKGICKRKIIGEQARVCQMMISVKSLESRSFPTVATSTALPWCSSYSRRSMQLRQLLMPASIAPNLQPSSYNGTRP